MQNYAITQKIPTHENTAFYPEKNQIVLDFVLGKNNASYKPSKHKLNIKSATFFTGTQAYLMRKWLDGTDHV
jgi:hypothetical protein